MTVEEKLNALIDLMSRAMGGIEEGAHHLPFGAGERLVPTVQQARGELSQLRAVKVTPAKAAPPAAPKAKK